MQAKLELQNILNIMSHLLVTNFKRLGMCQEKRGGPDTDEFYKYLWDPTKSNISCHLQNWSKWCWVNLLCN